MPAPVNEEYVEQTADADEYEEVRGGNYPDVWDFDVNPVLEGVYNGFVEKQIKGKDRIIHSFDVAGTEFQSWGAAVLNSRLEGLEGAKVKVHKTGQKLTSQSGNQPWEFKVYVAKSALAR